MFVLIAGPAFSAGGSGGSSGGGEAKPASQYQIAEKMIKKAKIKNIMNAYNAKPDSIE